MTRGERRIVEPELGQRARPEVLDQDIALRDQAFEHLPPLGMLEVEGHAFLVPVDAEEVRALAVHVGAPGARTWRAGVMKRRAPGARVVALARLLDFDDPRAHVGEQHRAIRTGQHAGEVENGDPVEWRHNGRMIIVYAGSA